MSNKVENEATSKDSLKIKKKAGRPRKMIKENSISKVDLSVKKEETIENKTTTKVEDQEQVSTLERIEPEPKAEEVVKEEEQVTIIKEKAVEKIEAEVKEAVRDERVSGITLPENVEKLVSFMEETGGTVEDYVTLNKDYNKYDDNLLVKEFYKKTRPHLNDEEVRFIMEDNFTYDEEADEERFVRKQKLAYKEEVAKAKNFLEQMKSKYYDEIKLRPSVTNEQKKAMEFFQRYNTEQETLGQARQEFLKDTEDFFHNKFEGFNFEVGDQRFKYQVSNPTEMTNAQSDVTKIISKFTDKEGNINDLSGYHKALYAARNADRLAEHFYEQGKADATRDIISKSKNIDNEPKAMATEAMSNGWKVRAISGVDSSKLKIKKKS